MLKNNSAESKPAGLSWECCGLASPTELNWNALFVFQQACKSWQRSDQLFKPCWTALAVLLLYLVRGPAEKLRVKQVVGLAGGCVWEVCGVRWFFFCTEEKCLLSQKDVYSCTLLFSSEEGACCVNRNVSSSLGNYFMLVMLHRLA